jgi:hypothetical protein
MTVTDQMIKRMKSAVQGECDGLSIEAHHARAILEYVLQPSLAPQVKETPAPQAHVAPQFLPTEDGEFNGNEQPEPDLSALEEIKYLACTAGAPGHMPVPKALARILTLCNRAGVTKKLDELRPLFATTEDNGNG